MLLKIKKKTMGFTIETYQLYGLPSLANIYVTIKGSYSVKKFLIAPANEVYLITFTVYFQAGNQSPVITQKDMDFTIQELPNPAVLYLVIYDYVKGKLDRDYSSNGQRRSDGVETLTFVNEC
jgi:hypothetical protein